MTLHIHWAGALPPYTQENRRDTVISSFTKKNYHSNSSLKKLDLNPRLPLTHYIPCTNLLNLSECVNSLIKWGNNSIYFKKLLKGLTRIMDSKCLVQPLAHRTSINIWFQFLSWSNPMLTVKSLLKHPAPIPLALARETYPALRPVTSCRTIPCASYSYHLSQLRRWPTSWDSPTCWARIGKDAPHTEVVFLGTQETLQRTQQKTL